MERNENGFSGYNFAKGGGRNDRCPSTGDMWQGEKGRGCCQNPNGSTSDNPGTNGNAVGGVNENGDSLGGDGAGCATRQLAMVYSPYQCWRMLYSPDEALKHGCLFEELYKPLEEY